MAPSEEDFEAQYIIFRSYHALLDLIGQQQAGNLEGRWPDAILAASLSED